MFAKQYLFALIFAAMLLIGVTPCAQAQVDFERETPALPIEDIIDKLDLSADQHKALEALKEQTRAMRAELKAAWKEKRLAIKQELKKKDFDKGKIDALTNEIKAIQEKLIDDRVASIVRVKAILTPEQYERFQALTENRFGSLKK